MTSVMPEVLAQGLFDFWFGTLEANGLSAPEKSQRWFKLDPAFDKLLAKHYGEYTDPALMGAFDRWLSTDVGLVALILLVDQIPRNIYRGQARAFYYDQKALSLALDARARGRTGSLAAMHAVFALMPLMHAEDLLIQNQSLEAFTELQALHAHTPLGDQLSQNVAEALRHRDIIKRFGRFPTRNEALNRVSTADEIVFLGEASPH